MLCLRLRFFLPLALVGLGPVFAADPDLATTKALCPVGGLIVQVGSTGGTFLASLSAEGKIITQGLVLKAADLDQARLELGNTQGLATVVDWIDRRRLPWASRLANVVIADLDALGADSPSTEELVRVTAPEGKLLLKKNGAWQTQTVPRPATISDWGDFDYNASGNAVSKDMESGPVRQQQWITALMDTPLGSNPAGFDMGAGIRIFGGVAVAEFRQTVDRTKPYESPSRIENWVIQGRDAFNGTPLWSIPRDQALKGRRWELAGEGNTLLVYLKPDQELSAIDVRTGATLRTFPGSNRLKNSQGDQITVRLQGNNVLVSLATRLLCYDLDTGSLRWTYSAPNLLVGRPIMDSARGRVWFVLSKEPTGRVNAWLKARYPVISNAQAIVSLDLTTGQEVWRNTDIASRDVADSKDSKGPIGIGTLVATDKYLVFFAGIDETAIAQIGSLDMATGALVTQVAAPVAKDFNVGMNTMLVRDNAVWIAGGFSHIWRFDPATGTLTIIVKNSFNQRCTRMMATEKWLLYGISGWFDNNGAGEQVTIARSGCAIGNIPANGMTYFTPNICGCATMVQGFNAMTPEPASSPTPNASRLLGTRQPQTVAPLLAPPAGLITAEWSQQLRIPTAETTPVIAGDLSLVATTFRNRLEARKGGLVVWAFTADARISQAPLVTDGKVYFGAHDGSVYCVSLADGALLWRRLIAPYERWISVNAQLESTWPVYGLALREGVILASAGTHVGLDGGVTLVGLDPGTGAELWKRAFKLNPNIMAPGGKAGIISHSFHNATPIVEADGLITVGRDPLTNSRSFTFSLATPEIDLLSLINNLPGGSGIPTVSDPFTITLKAGATSGTINLTVADANTSLSALTLTAKSYAPELIPSGNLVLAGTGETRNIRITANANVTGTARILLTVSDGSRQSYRVFQVRVTP